MLADGADPEASDGAAVRVRVLMSLSTVQNELRGEDVGRLRWREAEELADRSGAPGIRFSVDSAVALQLLRRGEHAAALERFAAAERNAAYASRSEACILHLNRGNLLLQQLALPAARRELNRCLDLTAAAEPRSGVPPDGPASEDDQLRAWRFMAQHNLGYLEFLAGNLPLALRLMDEAAAEPVGVSYAIAALDKARVLIEAGLSDAADTVLQRAAQEFRRGRLYHELAETELARADCAVLSGRLKAARALAGSARTRFRRRGEDRWRRVAELTLLAADLADGRPPARLVGPALRLRREFAAHDLSVQSRMAALIAVTALVVAGRLDEAGQILAELPPLGGTDPIGVRLQQRAATAAWCRAAGRPARARRQIRIGLAELGRHQAQFGSLDLQTASAIHGSALVRLDLELALAEGRPRAVFDAIERGRAVSRRLPSVTPVAGESADLLAELRSISELLRAIGDDPDQAGDARRMRTRMAELYGQLNAISWRADGAGRLGAPAPMAEVLAAAADRDTVVVSYCLLGGRWSAVVLGAGRPRWVPLPGDDRTVELARRAQADLDVLAYDSLPAAMRGAATDSLQRTLDRLDAQLIRPLRLGDARLALIPTGRTTTLPWSGLPSLRGRPVEVAPSATSWLAGVRAVDTDGPVLVAALAGPGLLTAGREAAEVARWWHGRAVAGPDDDRTATRERVSTALTEATVVHVAAHGAHVRQNPLFSSLHLADGPLYAYEIAERRVAPHVVLSACELGQSTARSGDEALGLARVLLQRGAQCVVAGVAQVADHRAADVMADYHRRLSAGLDSATALAEATGSGAYVPFVCFGSAWSTPLPGPEPVERVS